MIPLPTAVFFDWDGTLVDTLPFIFAVHNDVRAAMGDIPWTQVEFKEISRYSSRELYPRIYGQRAPEAMAMLQDFVDTRHLEYVNPFLDAFALLDALKQTGIPVGIVSNKRHAHLLKEIAHLGWDTLVCAAVGAGEALRDKPEADPLLLALDRAGVAPSESVWYVGDSETDILTARAAGCMPVLLRHHHDNAALVEAYDPLPVFTDCAALAIALQKEVE